MKFYGLVGLFIYFAVLLAVVLKEKKSHNAFDFFFAGRTMPFWALSITFIASWWGAGSALSTADLAYDDGMGAFIYYGMPVLLSTFLLILAAKAIRRIDYLTQGEMMEARYSRTTSKMLSVMILIFMIFNAASQMVGVGMFFGSFLGISYQWAVILGTVMVLIYSMFGGFRAVVLTDIIQFCLLTVAALVVFFVAYYNAGGLSNIAFFAAEHGKEGYMDMSHGFEKYLMYVITFGCSWVIQANVWQRISAARNVRDAKRMASMSFFLYIPLYLIVVLTGMAGFVLFPQLPEEGVVAAIVTNYMSPLLGGIVFVGIAAAIMSTMDSLINTGAMTLILDLGMGKENNRSAISSKFATLLVSVIAILIALRIRSILTVSWIASDVITTGVFIPLILGFVWRRGTSRGASASMFGGLLYCLYNLLIQLDVPLPAFWEHGTFSQVLTGMLLSAVIYITVSLVTAPEYEKADRFIAKAGILKKRS